MNAIHTTYLQKINMINKLFKVIHESEKQKKNQFKTETLKSCYLIPSLEKHLSHLDYLIHIQLEHFSFNVVT